LEREGLWKAAAEPPGGRGFRARKGHVMYRRGCGGGQMAWIPCYLSEIEGVGWSNGEYWFPNFPERLLQTKGIDVLYQVLSPTSRDVMRPFQTISQVLRSQSQKLSWWRQPSRFLLFSTDSSHYSQHMRCTTVCLDQWDCALCIRYATARGFRVSKQPPSQPHITVISLLFTGWLTISYTLCKKISLGTPWSLAWPFSDVLRFS